MLHSEIDDLNIKKCIRHIQQSYIWTIDTITTHIYPLLDYCILTGSHNRQVYLGTSLIYWFITDGPLTEYKSIILDSLKDERDLIDIINYIDGNYVPTKLALD